MLTIRYRHSINMLSKCYWYAINVLSTRSSMCYQYANYIIDGRILPMFLWIRRYYAINKSLYYDLFGNLLSMCYRFKLLLRSLWPNAINMLSECYGMPPAWIYTLSMKYQWVIDVLPTHYQNRIVVLPKCYQCHLSLPAIDSVRMSCWHGMKILALRSEYAINLVLMRYQLAMNELSMRYCAFCSCYQYRPRVILERYRNTIKMVLLQ